MDREVIFIKDVATNIISENLPREMTFNQQQGLLRFKETKTEVKAEIVSYFVPYVQSKVVIINLTDGSKEEYAEGVLVFDNNVQKQPETFLIPTSKDMKKKDWYKLNDGCITNPDCRLAEEYLMQIIRYGATLSSVKEKYKITKLGWHEIEGRYYYCDGNKLIGGEYQDDIIIEAYSFNDSEYRIVTATDRYNEREAIKGMIKAMRLYYNISFPVVLYTISGILRCWLSECAITPDFVLYIHGLSGIWKTTYVPLLSQIHNRDKKIKPITRLNSTTYSMELLLNAFPDSVLIFDDLFPSDNEKKKFDKSDEKLVEIIRIIGDGTGKQRKGIELEPLCNVIALGEEELPANSSTHARCLSIPFTAIVDKNILAECQDEPLLISTFYSYFIEWCTANQDKIKNDIKVHFSNLRKNNNNFEAHARLKDIYNVFQISYGLFMKYVSEVIDADTESNVKFNILKVTAEFDSMILKLILNQNQKIKKNRPIDYLNLINKLYRSGKLDVSNELNKFGKHKCAISKDNYLCIKTEYLIVTLLQYAPNATHDSIMKQLKASGALKFETENEVKKIYTPKSCKERIRSVNIRLDMLK